MNQATLTDRPYVNSNLFSSHYLDERIQEREEWDCDDAARAAMDSLRSLYDAERDAVETYDEGPLVNHWIEPVLGTLGFSSSVEIALPDGSGFVDELLFADDETRLQAAEVYSKTDDTTDVFERGLGILEAKQWDADFASRFSERRPYRNASHQIKHYLEKTPENLQWGILTNGRTWRLYGTKDYETQTYYEVDLPDLLESGDLEAFKYFYVFFRPDALRETAGTTFLEEVWAESETAAQELGEDLQDNVFTALRVLGRGFVETNDMNVDPDDDAQLDELKEQSLVLLYRLMFVLYAEARGLVHPEESEARTEYEENFSLDALRLEIHDAIGEVDEGFDAEYSDHSTTMWSRLSDLFGLIDQGEPSLGIPAYNGGLFDHEKHEFLTTHDVSNRYLAEVIYRLSTTLNADGRYVLADYADLDTRHLGSVYEGLLEHQFRIAPEPYAAVAADGGQVWTPADDVAVADAVETVPEGGLYVVNDEGERKATGTYYTPDYVVTYIVEQTVGPLVDEIEEELEAEGLQPGTEEYVYALSDRVLDLRILDPAMGSGHFLTRATGYLAERIMAEVREVEAEVGTLYDEQDFRRKVAKECIYGVDRNGMAVELAKLSMWLETLAADKPLAFFDHNLKTGNSLVGSDVTAVLSSDDPGSDGQLTLQQAFAQVRERTLEHVMDLMQDLLAIDNENLDDVRSMEDLYAEIRSDPLYQRLFELTNVHTAEQFGLDVPEGAYERMANAIEDDPAWNRIASTDWYRAAQREARSTRFFHWELEFPAVFFDADGTREADAGFDAVIGNPPYVNLSELPDDHQQYLSSAYPRVYAGNSDVLYYFMQRSLEASRLNGTFGLIVARYFANAQFADGLREYLLEEGRLVKIVDFENFQAFPGVDVLADVVFCRRSPSAEEYDVTVLKLRDDSVSAGTVSGALSTEDEDVFSIVDLDVGTLSSEPWNLVDEATLSIKRKMETAGRQLGEWYRVVQSMQTGHNEALVVDEDEVEEYGIERALLKPLAKTKNVRRYLIRDLGEFVLWTEVPDVDAYPNAREYLSEYRDELEQRYDIDARGADWWRISNPRNAALFASDEPRILTPFMSTSNKFAVDTEQRFNDGGDVRAIFEDGAPVDLRYTLAILNSRLGEFYHKNTAKLKRDGYYEYYGNVLRRFPVLGINPDDSFEDAGIQPPAEDSTPDAVGPTPDADGPHDFLRDSAALMRERREQRHELNRSLRDHLGSYSDGPTLANVGLAQPPRGAADSILAETAEDRPNLRVGAAEVRRESPTSVEIRLTARYKPGDEDAHETDRWGYTETDPLPALRISDLNEAEADLIEAFVPVAVEEAGGFAGFRETATKTNSLVDRLRALTLPAVEDVRQGLASYRETVARAEELTEEIERTDELIDTVVYDLYGLTDEEIEYVERAVER